MQTFLLYLGVARGALAAARLACAGGAPTGSRVAGHFWLCGGVEVSCAESCLVCCESVRMVYTFTIHEEPVLIPNSQQRRTFDVRLGLPA